jgi:hypothetical protein
MTLPEVLYLMGMYWLVCGLVLCLCKRILP